MRRTDGANEESHEQLVSAVRNPGCGGNRPPHHDEEAPMENIVLNDAELAAVAGGNWWDDHYYDGLADEVNRAADARRAQGLEG
jgi:hypothetical protein